MVTRLYILPRFGVLRGVDKHLNKKIMQAIVELALKIPGELGLVEIAGMNFKHIGMDCDGRVFQIDQNFNYAIGFTGREGEERMIIKL